jgi:hypothetical protein
MTDSTGLIVISFFALSGFFLIVYIAGKANDLGAEIVTGVVRGTPVSTGVREGMLFQMWLPYETTAFALMVFVAFAELEMAGQVSAPGVKLLAHFVAFMAGVGSLIVLLVGPFALLQYRRAIRRAKAK